MPSGEVRWNDQHTFELLDKSLFKLTPLTSTKDINTFVRDTLSEFVQNDFVLNGFTL